MNISDGSSKHTSSPSVLHDPLVDFLRAVSAQAVLFGHMYVLMVANAAAPSTPWRLLRMASSMAHPAVVVFFFLSGLLVGARVLDQMAAGKFDVFDYGLRRFARLYSVIVPGLLLTAVCVWLTFEIQDGQRIVDLNRPWYPAWFSSDHSNSIEAFACNLISLQMIGCYQYGHNSSLWSLSNEAIYYALFPTLLIASSRSYSGKMRCICTAFAGVLIVAVFLSPTNNDNLRAWFYVSGFLIWCLGAVTPKLHIAVSRFTFRNQMAIYSPIMMVAALLGMVLAGPIRDIGISLALFVFFAFARIPVVTSVLSRVTCARPVKILAGYSYSLYFIHIPILLGLIAWMPSGILDSNLKLAQSGTNLLVYMALALIINTCSFFFSWAFETRSVLLYQFSRALFVSKRYSKVVN